MTKEEFIEIISSCKIYDENMYNYNMDSTLEGMLILQKHNNTKFNILEGTGNGCVYSLDLEHFIDSITEEDAKKLNDLGWGYEERFDCLYHFV